MAKNKPAKKQKEKPKKQPVTNEQAEDEELECGLTAKQRRFCEEYVIDWNGTRAYDLVYPDCTKESARRLASQLLTNVDIKAYIEQVQKDLSKLTGVTAARNIIELRKMAYASIADLKIDWDDVKDWDDLTEDQKAAISEIEIRITGSGEFTTTTTKIKMHDKKACIDLLNKMLGFNAPDKSEITGKDGAPLINLDPFKMIRENAGLGAENSTLLSKSAESTPDE